MSDLVIKVEGLGKRYRLGERAHYKSLRESLAGLFRRSIGNRQSKTENALWALRDVSFEVRHGEVIGIIGRNGAGKSTLLKILARITEPSEGSADIHGRVGSLLEVGTGFHPELTGRENIYLNGAILGMRRAEVGRKFDEIVAFAEVEKFLDTPVKHYSSGMAVRLAFAVAAHLEPEILLVDEVLAVGDAAFQEKCLDKMGAVARGGRTILFVSHNMAAVLALCSRAYLLGQGNLIASGTPTAVVETYLEQRQTAAPPSLRDRQDRQGNGRMRFLDLAVRNAQGKPVELVVSGQDIVVEISYAAKSALRNVSVSLGVYGMLGQFLLFCGNEMTGDLFRSLPAQGKLLCRIPRLPLAPGRYLFNLYGEVNGVLADWLQQAGHLSVVGGDFFGTGRLPPASHGGLLIPHRWGYTEDPS